MLWTKSKQNFIINVIKKNFCLPFGLLIFCGRSVLIYYKLITSKIIFDNSINPLGLTIRLEVKSSQQVLFNVQRLG